MKFYSCFFQIKPNSFSVIELLKDCPGQLWDNWYWTVCDKRFGDEWPGRIPAQLVAHLLFFFSRQNDLVIDPMAGVGEQMIIIKSAFDL